MAHYFICALLSYRWFAEYSRSMHVWPHRQISSAGVADGVSGSHDDRTPASKTAAEARLLEVQKALVEKRHVERDKNACIRIDIHMYTQQVECWGFVFQCRLNYLNLL